MKLLRALPGIIATAILWYIYRSPRDPETIFWVTLAYLLIAILYCDINFHMLRDSSLAERRPYSFGRVQLAWWTAIVLASVVSILITRDEFPTLENSTLILLGISTATTAAARVIDTSDEANPDIVRHQDSEEPEDKNSNLLLDILSDENGVSIHRFQTVILNITFGLWFIITVLNKLPGETEVNLIIPTITDNNLILLGLSSATYAGLKASENHKTASSGIQETVPDESVDVAG